MMVLGMFVFNLCRSCCRCTLSTAFDMSGAISIVPAGGFFV